jgi:hypothetical protein
MQAPKDSKAYKNSINGVGKMVHRYSFTQVKPPRTLYKDKPSVVFKKKSCLNNPKALTPERVLEAVSSVKIFCCTNEF